MEAPKEGAAASGAAAKETQPSQLQDTLRYSEKDMEHARILMGTTGPAGSQRRQLRLGDASAELPPAHGS